MSAFHEAVVKAREEIRQEVRKHAEVVIDMKVKELESELLIADLGNHFLGDKATGNHIGDLNNYLCLMGFDTNKMSLKEASDVLLKAYLDIGL